MTNRRSTRRGFLRRSVAAAGPTLALAGLGTASKAIAKEPFQPKMAICNETFGDWPFERVFALAAECGYQGIEVAPFTIANDVTDIPAERRREIRKQAEGAGLQIIGLHWLLARTKGFHLTSPDADVRRRTADYLGELARFCADLGGGLLIFGSPKQRNLQAGVDRSTGLRYAAEVLTDALPVLEQTNVRLALEPLSPKITNFLSTAAEAVELIQRVNSPRCQLILDCLAMSTESASIPDLLRRYRRQLIHFHANDPCRRGPGFGDLDFVPIFRTLSDIDFGGWVSVEVFDYSPGPEQLARRSIEYMRQCLPR